jgi:hypothetical protein
MKRMIAVLLAIAAVYRLMIPRPKKERNRAAWGILLGCPCHDDGSMSTSGLKRCQLALDNHDKFERLAITGGAVKNAYAEAEVMNDWLEAHGLCGALLETKAANTWENFANVKAEIGDVPVCILTSSLHAPRAAAMAKHFFKDVTVCTYPEGRCKHVVREWISRLIYIRMEWRKAWNRLCQNS